jgi:tetratricopeptide (TPR) repeat protein
MIICWTSNPKMRRHDSIVLTLLCGVLFISSRALTAAAQPDPVSDAQQKLDAGQFKDAITIVTQSLTRSRPDDDSAQRGQLLTIKGEALLRMGQTATAASTFDMAVKSAPDVRTAALARANSLLIRASSQGKYRPRTGGGQPIEIIDPESRKQAFAALREDLSRTVKPKMQAALNGNTLPPLLDVLPSVMDLGYLEYAANGSAPTARDDLKELGAHARDLMNSELRKLRHQIDVLEDASNSTDNWNRRGLFSNERKWLTDQLPYLRRIEKTARDARSRARELGFDGAAWEPIIADAGDQADRAQAMLDVSP